MIVVTPTFYPIGNTDSSVSAAGDAEAHFSDELVNDLIPAAESAYPTYVETTGAAGLKASRNYRGFDGFSMGSVAPEDILIAYFGVVEDRNGMDTVANASRVGTSEGAAGNCQFIAQAIQQAVGGDLFAIETVQTYPGEHQALLDFAAAEMAANARPELSTSISNLDDYDVIFIGYPIWNADLPMPVYSFLAETILTTRSSRPSAPAPTAPLTTACTSSGSWPPARPLQRA